MSSSKSAQGRHALVLAPSAPAEGALVIAVRGGFSGVLHRGAILCRTFLPFRKKEDLLKAFARAGFTGKPGEVPPELAATADLLIRYWAGEAVDPAAHPAIFDPGPITPFARGVYAALRRIRRGETTTYGELAEKAGRGGASRAVGACLSRNPLAPFVPCHRVLAKGGGLGGFTSSGGLDEKRRMLALEAVEM